MGKKWGKNGEKMGKKSVKNYTLQQIIFRNFCVEVYLWVT